MIRPYIAPQPSGEGSYQAYICNSHVLFSGQRYNMDFSLCNVEDVVESYARLNENYRKHGYPYEVRGNGGKNWRSTCKLCFYQPNNELLHSVVSEIPDKNFP